MMNIPFQVMESGFEEIIDAKLPPEKNAEILARGKAQRVAEKFPNNIVVGVDTVVVSGDGKILEKPQELDDAKRMIAAKSGRKELVISGICVVTPRKTIVKHEVGKLCFSQFDENDVQKILNFHEWEGVSGAIRIEGKTSLYIEKIEGNFWNIVGFPVPTFVEMMAELLDES